MWCNSSLMYLSGAKSKSVSKQKSVDELWLCRNEKLGGSKLCMRACCKLKSSKSKEATMWCNSSLMYLGGAKSKSVSKQKLVGIGVVVRKSTKSVIFIATRRTHAYWPPKVAEANAIAVAVRLEEVILDSNHKLLTA
ncbi:hypothetical protein POM88_040106 [Heracleum sosnowskyi]|uniref:Uncharacterized protein n=1 Tax=Heracleum sosnowskyi TaxID=360622 RepID=A0AAD8M721_9APIA|nr:hypothetical protein POM88_040106 [Heracleum sosnowskyi]